MPDKKFSTEPVEGWTEVFCASIRHWKTNKRIFPKKGKVFHFWVKPKGPTED